MALAALPGPPAEASGSAPALPRPTGIVVTTRSASAIDVSWVRPATRRRETAAFEVVVDGHVARRVGRTRVHALVTGLQPSTDHAVGVRVVARSGVRGPLSARVRALTLPLPGERWVPTPADTWQLQYAGDLDASVDATVYDLDHEVTTRAEVAALHAAGRHVVCYVDAGTWESYRADAGAFPRSALGGRVDGWPDERWLDIRRLDSPVGPTGTTIRHLLVARIDQCAAKGFDAIDADWQGTYLEPTGFPITASQQVAFDRFLADVAHARGMSASLKNDKEQAALMQPHVDFAVDEQCQRWLECAGAGTAADPGWAAFVAAGKAVVNIEYVGETSTCAVIPGVTSIRKHLNLDAWIAPCGA